MGRSVRWRRRPGFRTRRYDGFGALSACSPIDPRRSSFPAIRCSSTRCATSSGYTFRRPIAALGLSVDEKSQIQALDREQPVLPMMPAIPERRTHSYVRHGTTSLFAALDTASGFVIGKGYKRHRAAEFLDFLKPIDVGVPEGLDVHIIMDNYATHKTAAIKAWLARRPNSRVPFTPTSASWINQVERWFAELTRKQLRRGVHTSIKQLEADIHSFIERHNDNPKPYRWTKSADEILASVKRFCQKTEQTLCSEV
jgi:transposase